MNVLKITALIVIILALLVGGLWWFRYIGVLKPSQLPFIHLPGYSKSAQSTLRGARLGKREQALAIKSAQVSAKEQKLAQDETVLAKKQQEIDSQQKSLQEKQDSLKQLSQTYEKRSKRVSQVANNLLNMPPANAVKILEAMAKDDPAQVLDVFHAADVQATQTGTGSLVPYWLSLMDPATSASLQARMAS